jgi:hypothetical protein
MLRLFVKCNEKIFSIVAWKEKERAPASLAGANQSVRVILNQTGSSFM